MIPSRNYHTRIYMKRMKLVITIAIILSLLPNVPLKAATIKLNKKKVTLYVGKTTVLKVKGTKNKVKWSSSRKKVASVNKKGKVTAKRKGKTTIQAKVSGKTLKCKVTVKKYNSLSGNDDSSSEINLV